MGMGLIHRCTIEEVGLIGRCNIWHRRSGFNTVATGRRRSPDTPLGSRPPCSTEEKDSV
jgi:hypothetical protein